MSTWLGRLLPELDALAVLAGEGHGVGQHVIELGERRRREAAHPIGPLGLHALVDGLALEHRRCSARSSVVVAQDRGVLVLLRAGVLDDAELDVALAGQRQHLVDGAVVEVDVEVDEGKVEVMVGARVPGQGTRLPHAAASPMKARREVVMG